MQRLVYFFIFPVVWITSKLPFWLLYLKSDLLFFVAYRLIGYRKKVVMNNLNLVFPDRSDKELKTIARDFYRHLCDLVFETIKNLTVSETSMKARFRFENLELIDQLYKDNRSVMLLCGHYATWEWTGILNRFIEYKGYAVYKPLANPYLDRLVRMIRGRFGAEIVSNKKIVQRLFLDKRDGLKNMTLILADQTPKLGAYKQRDLFMGVDVPVFTGPEELAKKLDSAVVYLRIHKLKRGYYSARFVPLTMNSPSHPDFEITRMFLDELESQIKEHPPLYLWSHKRWKHRSTQ
jgi:KDO2-lipid IV(A) lauroyltransferase